MKKVVYFLAAAAVAVLAAVLIIPYRAYHVRAVDGDILKKIDTEKASCLMIVAHPDDETLWGGAHLCSDDYLVVCVTNASNKKRAAEFKKAMGVSDDQFIMLDYPDKVFGKRDDWSHVRSGITDDIEKIISLKDWKLVATHNLQGEYGHVHHQMTSDIVTEVYDEKHREYPLYYFGTYYRAAQTDELKKLTPQNKDKLEQKDKMLESYSSQDRVVKKFRHILDYEQWEQKKGN